MNYIHSKPVDALPGALANSARRVFVEYGLVYDVNREEWVNGMVIHVGNSAITVTEPQAERISEEIDGKFLSDHFDTLLDDAISRHPSSRVRNDYE